MLKDKIFNWGTKQKLFFLVLILPLFLAGCINVSNKSKTNSGLTGGFFRSNDLGASWQKMNTLYTIGNQTATFDAASVTVMTYDPLDDSAIYLGTLHDGIFYSYDYGGGWVRTLAGLGTVNDIVVDPERNCTIFSAVHNVIYKTTDCSRTWKKVYFDPGKGQFISSIDISQYDNSIVFAGTSGGSLLRSEDYGASWDVIERLEDNIKNIFVVNNKDDQAVYAVTQSKGIFKSFDDGLTWINLLGWQVDQAEVNEDEVFEVLLAEREEKKLAETCQGLSRGEIREIEKGIDDADRRAELVSKAQDEKYKQTCQSLTKDEKIQLEKDEKYAYLYEIRGSNVVLTASLDRSVDDAIIYANNGSIYRLIDAKYGPMWKQIKLLTPPNSKEAIFSALVNPKNTNEIFYGTSAALYHSIDNGGSWSISELPTDHSARSLSFSLDNRFLYLGAYKINK